MVHPKGTALGIEYNRKAHVYKVNDIDWWCDYSPEEAKKNYVKFAGISDENYEEPIELTEEELNRLKYKPDERAVKPITFKEELANRVIYNDVPSFFASTEW